MTFAELDRRVMLLIRRTPSVRASEIADRLGEPTVDVRASLYRLKRTKRVRRSGNTRATVYTAR